MYIGGSIWLDLQNASEDLYVLLNEQNNMSLSLRIAEKFDGLKRPGDGPVHVEISKQLVKTEIISIAKVSNTFANTNLVSISKCCFSEKCSIKVLSIANFIALIINWTEEEKKAKKKKIRKRGRLMKQAEKWSNV